MEIEKPVPVADELQSALLSLAKKIDQEDETAYQDKVKQVAGLEQYWLGNQYLFWSGDRYQTPRQLGEQDAEQFERIFNIYRAHGEAIIAALGVEVPQVAFYPHDASDPDDIATSKTYTKLSRVVEQENRAELLIIRILTILYNGGLVAGYNYHERLKKYGEVPVNETETKVVKETVFKCPQCDTTIPENMLNPQEPMIQCPNCQAFVAPIPIENEKEVITKQEIKWYPKGKERCMVYSPLFVKLPMYVQSQEHCGYLRLAFEVDRGFAISNFKNIRAKITKSGLDDYDRQMRQDVLYSGTYKPDNLVTIKKYWIRPWYFYNLDNEDNTDKLLTLFPNGCYLTTVNDVYAEAFDELLDEHWTISESPMSTYIYADPIGKQLKPVQDRLNEVDRLILATMEYSVPFTAVDSEVLNLNKFSQTRCRPGDFFNAKAPLGKALSDGFFTIKAATISQELSGIRKQNTDDGQFAVGSFPSIYGGQMEGGSKTFSEYAASRNMALQRLSIHWKSVVDFWTRMMEKAVTSRARNLDEDEQFTDKQDETFVTIWIRRGELTGKIGRVVSEASEKLPLSWMQKKDQITQLMNMGSEEINSVLFHPENANLMAQLFGFPELFIPGADQRSKQYREIRQMERGEPAVVDLYLDDHEVHSLALQTYMISEAGLLLKEEQPEYYQMMQMHYLNHQKCLAQAQMAEQNNVNAEAESANQGQQPKENQQPEEVESEQADALENQNG